MPVAPKSEPAAPPVLLTAPAAARALGVSERKLRYLTVPNGPLPVVRIGRMVRYRVATLREFAARQETGPGQAPR